MELPHVGNRCSKDGCGQLDFLPVVCSHCRRSFCSTHGSAPAHACPNIPNATASTAGCANEEPVSKYTHPDRGPAKHAHAKPKKVLSAEQLKALEALKQASCQPRKLPAKTGQPTMSPKIELMRLKSKASGNANIAMADRLYLSVQWQDRSLPVFINKNTKVGSAALQFSKLLRLSQLPDKVYRLHVPEAAVPLPSNQLFSELMPSGSSDGGLFNGCTLELKCL